MQAASTVWLDRLRESDAQPSRLADMLVERLSDAIIAGDLKPGEALPSEGQIALSFGVSKPVVREALRELASVGVLHVQHGKATRVREISSLALSRFYRFAVGASAEGLRQAVEVRRILEPQLAGLAARRRAPADCSVIETLIGQMEAAQGDVPRWIELDLAFHAAIAAATHNRLLILQMTGLKPVFGEILERFNSRANRTRNDWQHTFERHRLIAKEVIAGDAEAATRAMTVHFEAADVAIAELFPES